MSRARWSWDRPEFENFNAELADLDRQILAYGAQFDDAWRADGGVMDGEWTSADGESFDDDSERGWDAYSTQRTAERRAYRELVRARMIVRSERAALRKALQTSEAFRKSRGMVAA